MTERSSYDGFTIIEVMIVLAIAGLIMLVVFLAVPALQRSTRNHERKQDASMIAATMADFSNNHGNQLPNRIRSDPSAANQLDFANSSDLNSLDTASIAFYYVGTDSGWGHNTGQDNIENGIFLSHTVVSRPITPTLVAPSQVPANEYQINTDSLSVIIGEGCNDTNTAAGNVSPHLAAVFYVLETASSNGNMECIESR
jgi:prepilin-type N-terminal cleavage/methylation domain-containing protein